MSSGRRAVPVQRSSRQDHMGGSLAGAEDARGMQSLSGDLLMKRRKNQSPPRIDVDPALAYDASLLSVRSEGTRDALKDSLGSTGGSILAAPPPRHRACCNRLIVLVCVVPTACMEEFKGRSGRDRARCCSSRGLPESMNPVRVGVSLVALIVDASSLEHRFVLCLCFCSGTHSLNQERIVFAAPPPPQLLHNLLLFSIL